MSTLKVNAIRGTGASSDAISVNSTDGTCTAKITNNLSNRNLVINGAMNVAQRGTSITAEGFVADRWDIRFANLDEAPTTTQHALTSSDTGPWEKGFRHSLHLQNGNQTSGAGASDYLFMGYKIEAQDLASSGWDYTSASSYLTLSFWVKSSVAQNFYPYFRTKDGTGKLYSWETGSLSANTWTKITKKIPGASNLQFDNNANEGMEINIPVWWGGTWTTSGNTLNTWATFDSNDRVPDNTSTWFTTNDATFEITGVQLEVGDVATDFEHKSYSDEFARCCRYFYAIKGDNNDVPGFMVAVRNIDTANFCRSAPYPMRTIPAYTGSGDCWVYSSNNSAVFDLSVLQLTLMTTEANPTIFSLQAANTLSSMGDWGDGVLQFKEDGCTMYFSAEL